MAFHGGGRHSGGERRDETKEARLSAPPWDRGRSDGEQSATGEVGGEESSERNALTSPALCWCKRRAGDENREEGVQVRGESGRCIGSSRVEMRRGSERPQRRCISSQAPYPLITLASSPIYPRFILPLLTLSVLSLHSLPIHAFSSLLWSSHWLVLLLVCSPAGDRLALNC